MGLAYRLPSISTLLPVLSLTGLQGSCCQPQEGLSGIRKRDSLSFLSPQGMYLFTLLSSVLTGACRAHVRVGDTQLCSSAPPAEMGAPLCSAGSPCFRPLRPSKAASFTVALCARARQPPEALRLPSSMGRALLPRKATGTKENSARASACARS